MALLKAFFWGAIGVALFVMASILGTILVPLIIFVVITIIAYAIITDKGGPKEPS